MAGSVGCIEARRNVAVPGLPTRRLLACWKAERLAETGTTMPREEGKQPERRLHARFLTHG